MKFRVDEVQYNERQVWRIVGPSNEHVGREAYSSRAEAASDCQKFNDEHAALEQAVKSNEIMALLSSSDGRVCALFDQAARVHFGRGSYKNVLLPLDVTPNLGDTLLVIDGVITIAEPKEADKGNAR